MHTYIHTYIYIYIYIYILYNIHKKKGLSSTETSFIDQLVLITVLKGY